MDPNLVYSRYRDDAFAFQLEAERYDVFVAMPFRERFSYRSRDVYSNVIQEAAKAANQEISNRGATFGKRRFAVPSRVDDAPQTAQVIDEEIIKRILFSHVVVADLTFANDGVLLEVGATLAFKPTAQIVLITQGSPSELHFDVRNNAIISYTPADGVGAIARALVAAAAHFEDHRTLRLTQLRKELSRDAIWLMNWYGRCRTGQLFRNNDNSPIHTSLHEQAGALAFLEPTIEDFENATDAKKSEAMTRYQLAVRELLERRLIWTDYQPKTPRPGIDSYSARGTRLGWMFITHTWPELQCPPDELPPNGYSGAAVARGSA